MSDQLEPMIFSGGPFHGQMMTNKPDDVLTFRVPFSPPCRLVIPLGGYVTSDDVQQTWYEVRYRRMMRFVGNHRVYELGTPSMLAAIKHAQIKEKLNSSEIPNS
jgi:hypothetical protein